MFLVSRKTSSDVNPMQYTLYPYSLVKLLSGTGISIIYKTHAETSRNDVYSSKLESEKTRRTEKKKTEEKGRKRGRALLMNGDDIEHL